MVSTAKAINVSQANAGGIAVNVDPNERESMELLDPIPLVRTMWT